MIFIRHTICTAVVVLMLLTGFVPEPAAAEKNVPAAEMVKDNQPIDLQSSRYQQLFTELIELHNFNQAELTEIFAGVKIHRKVLLLMDKQWEAKPYYLYRPLFITSSVIRQGKRSLRKFAPLFDRIEAEFGVNREVIVAIWAVESRFGANTGGFNLFRSLNTLFDAYPRRSDFFRSELIDFLILCRANDLDALDIRGSYAGAFGQAQFMPSSFNKYAVDFDGDKVVDIITSMPDVFASIANYLKSFGWIFDSPLYAELGDSLKSERLQDIFKEGRLGRVDWKYVARTQELPIPQPAQNGQLSIVGLQMGADKKSEMRYLAGYANFHAITSYNHSHKYAMAVSELTQAFSQ